MTTKLASLLVRLARWIDSKNDSLLRNEVLNGDYFHLKDGKYFHSRSGKQIFLKEFKDY